MKKLITGLALIVALSACKKQETIATDLVVTDTQAVAAQAAPAGKSVQTAHAPPNHAQNASDDGKLTVYFKTNDWKLYGNDKQDLRAFARANRDADNWIIEGYCDERGSVEDNLRLGENRAKGVARFLKGNGVKGTIETVSYGEANPADAGHGYDAWKKNRRVMAVPSGEVITRGLTLLKGDAYLIDATGSMHESTPGGSSKWDLVTSYRYPKGAKLYIFNSCTGVDEVKRIVEASPDCQTPLWGSVEEVIGDLRKGSKLTVLTDGAHNYGDGSPERIIDLVRRRDIAVSFVGTGVSDYTKQELIRIARATGGKHYIKNN